MIAGKERRSSPYDGASSSAVRALADQPSGVSPIPQDLWALAVEVAREHGVNATAHVLHLNHTALKKRVQAAGASVRRRPPRATFVELPAPSSSLSPARSNGRTRTGPS